MGVCVCTCVCVCACVCACVRVTAARRSSQRRGMGGADGAGGAGAEALNVQEALLAGQTQGGRRRGGADAGGQTQGRGRRRGADAGGASLSLTDVRGQTQEALLASCRGLASGYRQWVFGRAWAGWAERAYRSKVRSERGGGGKAWERETGREFPCGSGPHIPVIRYLICSY
jgi:hypothetical protein